MKGFKRSFLIKVSKPFSGHKLRLEGILSREKSYKSIGGELDLKNLRLTELRKVFYTRRKESGIRLLRINRAGEQLAAMAIDKYDKKEWVQNKICYDAHDVINYQGQFCAVNEEGRTFLFNSSFAPTEISPPMVDNPNNYITSKWLVESCGELFMVELYNEKPTIYRLNMEQKAWIQVESLGDWIFFMVEGCSFSLSAQEFPGCNGSCVYFPYGEGKEDDERLRFRGPDTQDFDLETGRFGRITAFPKNLEIFWPPPKWLEHPSL
ncbi:unnamed protein product [Withania somnifera]